MGKKILCLEDNSVMQKLIVGLLRDDYDVTCCSNGQEFLDSLSSSEPDLFLLDIMLPDTNGHEVCREIRSREAFKKTPIIMLSSKTDVESKVKSYNLGAVNYIEKPFDHSELRAIVKSLISHTDMFNSHCMEVGNVKVYLDEQSLFIDNEKVSLTPSEFKIFAVLLKNNGAIVKREKLTGLLNEKEGDSADRLINYHMSLLRKKLKPATVSIRSVYGEGYKISE